MHLRLIPVRGGGGQGGGWVGVGGGGGQGGRALHCGTGPICLRCDAKVTSNVYKVCTQAELLTDQLHSHVMRRLKMFNYCIKSVLAVHGMLFGHRFTINACTTSDVRDSNLQAPHDMRMQLICHSTCTDPCCEHNMVPSHEPTTQKFQDPCLG